MPPLAASPAAQAPAAPPHAPVGTAPAQPERPRRARRAWLREAVLVLAIYFAYDGSRLLVRGGVERAQRDALHLLDVERWLHLSPEHWLNADFTGHNWLGVPADFAYATLHYVVTPAVLIWLWRRHRPHYRRARTWLAISTVLALVGFVLLPAAPPRLLPAAFGFTDTMAQHAGIGWWGESASAPKGMASMTNEFAAMPSLHVGWALWCGLMIFRYTQDRTVRTLGLLYPVMIALVVMGTGNHYLLDVLAGAGVVGLGRLLAPPAQRLTERLGNGIRGAAGRRRGEDRPARSAGAAATTRATATSGTAATATAREA